MGWLDNMVLRSKLILLTAVMLIGLLSISAIALNSVAKWEKDVDQLGSNIIPSLNGIMKMRVGYNQVITQLNRARGLINDPQRLEKWKDSSEQLDKAWVTYKEGYDVYSKLPMAPEEKAEFDKFEENFSTWKGYVDKFEKGVLDPLSSGTLALSNEEIFARMTAAIEGMRDSQKAMVENMNIISKINEDSSDASVKEAKQLSSEASVMTLTISSISLILAIILATLIIRSVTRSITASVTSIRDGAMQITSASDEVASSSSSLAQGASEQASSVEEVSATLEESTSINAQNTDNARQADILAKNANDAAKSGYAKGEQLSSSMHSITESAAKISGIIKAIDQIAFQTNLLALNAAVEAARAGEHGLGFAVVADEVRNLAQRAASAAKETSDIIEEVVQQIKEGNDIALSTHDAFKEILDHSKKVSDLIGEISQAGKEQNEGMKQISQAMGQVDQVTQQVAANSEEAAAAAEELNAQALSMMDSVKILAKIVGMDIAMETSSPSKVKLNKNLSIAHKNVPAPKKAPLATKAKEVFPLHEDDLKEF